MWVHGGSRWVPLGGWCAGEGSGMRSPQGVQVEPQRRPVHWSDAGITCHAYLPASGTADSPQHGGRQVLEAEGATQQDRVQKKDKEG